jgi:hypothetical protein
MSIEAFALSVEWLVLSVERGMCSQWREAGALSIERLLDIVLCALRFVLCALCFVLCALRFVSFIVGWVGGNEF